MKTEHFDAIIVGAGHNGLVCAALLAKANRRVLVLEANDRVGGAAVTREFAPGHSVSACAHLLYQLRAELIEDTGANIKFLAGDLNTVALARDGNHVRLNTLDVTGVSDADAERFREFTAQMHRFANLYAKLVNAPPPRLGTGSCGDRFALGKLALDLRRLGNTGMREFLRILTSNIHDQVHERFENPTLKGAICIDAVLGTHAGPRTPNTVMSYLHRLSGNHGRLATIKGGLGALSASLADAARNAGAVVHTGMPVRRIIVENGRVSGVEMESGECAHSYKVISNADPKRTVLELLGARHVESEFANRINRLRTHGNAAKLHLALDGLPMIQGLTKKDLRGRILIAPDEHYVERAFNPAKYGEYSADPVMELTFPSLLDDSLTPAGRHVMSAVVQYAPYSLREGWNDDAKKRFERTVFDTLSRFAPEIEQRTTASELLTPADIETEFHISGGHWHHAELALDQFFFLRPVSGAAQYAMPIDGLFLCGAGAHPGGGVSGAAGRNAARAILRLEKGA